MPETNLPSVLAMAIARRDEARREAAGWDDFIRRLELLGAKGSRSWTVTSDSTSFVGIDTPASPVKQRRSEPAVAATIEASISFMNSVGRPVGISELYDVMTQRNIPVGGKDPKRTLDARLRYSKTFKNLPGRGWWFADRPAPGMETVSAAGAHETSAADEGRTVEPTTAPKAAS